MKFTRLGALKGEIRFPGDKSICHRALMMGGIAEGRSIIRNFSGGDDNRSTLDCLRGMGVSVDEISPTHLEVQGVGLHGLSEPTTVLDAGNSGTTMRIMTGLLSAQQFFSVLTGDEHLRMRPMKRIIEPLGEMGAEIYGRQGNTLAPLAIRGRRLQGHHFTLKVASAQVKSALVLAGLYADGETVVQEPGPSRDHTERLLLHMGAELALSERTVRVRPVDRLSAFEIDVPGDISSAAFFIVAALIVPGSEVLLRNVGVNPTRTGIVDILREMNGDITYENERDIAGEPVADILVRHSNLKGVNVSGDVVVRAIDEFPALSVAAAMAEGETRITGAEELRVKETDRITAMTNELRKLGTDVEELPDGMVIRGGKTLQGAKVESYHDHRIAMSLAVTGLVCESPVEVEGFGVVSISYPKFADDLRGLTCSTGAGK